MADETRMEVRHIIPLLRVEDERDDQSGELFGKVGCKLRAGIAEDIAER